MTLVLHFIYLDPDYQRKGIGKWVIQHKLDEADKAGIPMLLVGTPAGLPLYRSMGFQEVYALDIDLKSRGIEGDAHWAGMVRTPPQQ